MVEATSCGGVVIFRGKILLLYKNYKNKYEGWVLPKGTVEEGEEYKETAIREVKEETGLTLTNYRLRGIITFISNNWGCEYMHLYTADGFEGSPDPDQMTACNEGILKWIPKSEIYDLNLWDGDRIFLKLLIETDKFFSLKLEYDGDDLIQTSSKIYD